MRMMDRMEWRFCDGLNLEAKEMFCENIGFLELDSGQELWIMCIVLRKSRLYS